MRMTPFTWIGREEKRQDGVLAESLMFSFNNALKNSRVKFISVNPALLFSIKGSVFNHFIKFFLKKYCSIPPKKRKKERERNGHRAVWWGQGKKWVEVKGHRGTWWWKKTVK